MNACLSPRVRGNQPIFGERSIPARTGEPYGNILVREQLKVYPRAYGGTRSSSDLPRNTTGLSPRVRGNLDFGEPHALPHRSIPARTGEPSAFTVTGRARRVYPRAYGGTPVTPSIGKPVAGLSPRVRGNR